MRERPTVRVLLFDGEGRLLLIRGRTPGRPETFWFTAGGGVDPGESLTEAALREVREETGLDCALGPVVWLRQGVGTLHSGERVLFQESYFVARSASAELNREGWEPHEHELMDEMRWWTLEDIRTTADIIYPEMIASLLPDVIAGRYPDPPLRLVRGEEDL